MSRYDDASPEQVRRSSERAAMIGLAALVIGFFAVSGALVMLLGA